MLYVTAVPAHGVAEPVIAPAPVPPVEGVTAKVAAVALIQVPFPFAVMLPVVALGVTVMELVVDVPVQPAGKVQV